MHSADRPPRSARLWVGMAVLIVSLLPAFDAGGHDGDIRWKTLRSDVAEVHYPARLEPFARQVLAAFGDAWRTLTPLFDYRPPLPVQLAVDDYVDDSNGFANPFPYDRLLFRAYPPSPTDDLADNGDWLRALVFHEYSHLLHLATTGGLPDVVNTVLGRTWLPNNFLPRFFVEGLATHVETRHVGADRAVANGGAGKGQGGRIEGARYMGRLRAAVVERTFPEPRQLTGPPLHWPRSAGWYLYGSWLLDYQVRRYGHPRLRRFIRAYGSRLVPYAINNLYRDIYGRDAVTLWREGVDELRRRVAVEGSLRAVAIVPPVAAAAVLQAAALSKKSVAHRPPPRSRRLTRDGQSRGRLRMHPNGYQVVYGRAPADDLARIERLDLNSGAVDVLHRCELNCDDVIVTPDGAWLLWMATRPHRRLYRHREIFARRLGKGGAVGPVLQLTRGLRGRELSVSPDGVRLWVVTIKDGLTGISSLPLAETLARAGAGRPAPPARLVVASARFAAVLSSPVEGPCGRLWYTRSDGAMRRLWWVRLGVDGGPVTDPVLSRARFAAAVSQVSADGRSLGPARVRWVDDLQVFQRDGKPWLGALVGLGSYRDAAELALSATQTAWRMRSWTRTGAYSAAFAPTGGLAVASMVHGHGLDIHRLAAPQGSVAPPISPQSATAAAAIDAYRPPAGRPRADSYSSLHSLRPRSWEPLFELQATDLAITAEQITTGATIQGVDAARLLRWQLFGRTDLALRRPAVIASFGLERWEPHWSGVLAWSEGTSYGTRAFRLLPMANRRFAGRFGGSWGLPFARQAVAFEASVRMSHISLTDDEALWRKRDGLPEPFGPEPVEPTQGTTVQASAGITWDRSERYPDSIEIERQRRLALFVSYADHWALVDRRLLRLDLRGDLSWPLGGHRVLQWRSRAGWALDHPRGDPAFRLEGLAPWSAETLLFGGAGGDFGVVRGIAEPEAGGLMVAGRGLFWSSVALHLPLAGLGSGLDILPVFLGRARLSLFGDGAVLLADLDYQLRHTMTGPGAVASIGGEFRVDLETGYMSQGSLRLGFARAFGDIESSQWYIRLGY